MSETNTAAREPAGLDAESTDSRLRRAGGVSILAGSLALIASLALGTRLPAGATHVEFVTHPLWLPIVAVDFVALTLITLGGILLARGLLLRGAHVSMVAALLGVTAAYVLGVAELVVRGVAAPAMAELLSNPDAANGTIELYAALGGGLVVFTSVLHAGALGLIGYAIHRSGFFSPAADPVAPDAGNSAIGLVGAAIAAATLLVQGLEFFGVADLASVAMPMTVLLYGYLLALGAVMLRTTRDSGSRFGGTAN